MILRKAKDTYRFIDIAETTIYGPSIHGKFIFNMIIYNHGVRLYFPSGNIWKSHYFKGRLQGVEISNNKDIHTNYHINGKNIICYFSPSKNNYDPE